jgi:hypothetical protein
MSQTQRGRPRKQAPRKPRARRSVKVTATGDAMDPEKDLLKSGRPKRVARSLKRPAKRSRRGESGPIRSAMSVLNFYINRGGKGLSTARRNVLEAAKTQLRRLFRRPTTQ